MNKLRNEIMWSKMQINSIYGVSRAVPDLNVYDELLRKKNRFFKIQKRVLKIKRLYEGY